MADLNYIRKNREETAIIYLKENDCKATQRMFCTAHAMDCGYEILGETTDLNEVQNCDLMLVASVSVITRDVVKYYTIEKELRKKGIRIEAAMDNNSVGKYIDMALELYRKGRI